MAASSIQAAATSAATWHSAHSAINSARRFRSSILGRPARGDVDGGKVGLRRGRINSRFELPCVQMDGIHALHERSRHADHLLSVQRDLGVVGAYPINAEWRTGRNSRLGGLHRAGDALDTALISIEGLAEVGKRHGLLPIPLGIDARAQLGLGRRELGRWVGLQLCLADELCTAACRDILDATLRGDGDENPIRPVVFRDAPGPDDGLNRQRREAVGLGIDDQMTIFGDVHGLLLG